jgi:hypothetical protein
MIMLWVRNDATGRVDVALERLLWFDATLQFVLLAVLDSTPDLRGSPSLDTYRSEGLQFVGTQALVHRRVAERMLKDDALFTGFDEAWLFVEPPTRPRPDGCVITTDTETLADPVGLERWMCSTHAHVGLGDGLGLRAIAVASEATDALSRALFP